MSEAERSSALSGADETISLGEGLRLLHAALPRPRQTQFRLLCVLTVAGAVAELGTIGALFPLLTLLADPAGTGVAGLPARDFAGMGRLFKTPTAAALAFAAFAVAAGILRFRLSGLTQEFGFRLGHDLLVAMQRRILAQPYPFHLERNTSSLLSAPDKVESLVSDLVLPLIQAAVALVLAVAIAGMLIVIEPVATIIAASVFTSVYLLISLLVQDRLTANSKLLARSFDRRIKASQEALGGIRDVIIDQSQPFYLRWFERVDRELNAARISTGYISIAPRHVVETAGILAICAIAIWFADQPGGLTSAIPLLGALALGAQRLLPLVQQVYHGWTFAAGNRSLLADSLALLDLPLPDPDSPAPEFPLALKDSLSFEGVTYSYPTRRAPALEDLSLTLPAGSSLALVGPTGSGKSTLADLAMGLIEPNAGFIRVDGAPLDAGNCRQWQSGIAHVSQSVFLADASIERNVALSMPDQPVDRERVISAVEQAQLGDFIASLDDGLDTLIGERGVRLSGGQRQRIGIARAIYKQAPILVLDEATSALDEATEAAVIAALDRLRGEGRTLIVIAHRQSTIARCDLVARLENGRLVAFGPLHA